MSKKKKMAYSYQVFYKLEEFFKLNSFKFPLQLLCAFDFTAKV